MADNSTLRERNAIVPEDTSSNSLAPLLETTPDPETIAVEGIEQRKNRKLVVLIPVIIVYTIIAFLIIGDGRHQQPHVSRAIRDVEHAGHVDENDKASGKESNAPGDSVPYDVTPIRMLQQFSMLISYGILIVIIAELFYRAALLVEEKRHLKTRYNGSCSQMVTTVMSFQTTTVVAGFLSMAVVLIWIVVDLDWVKEFWRQNSYMLLTWLVFNSALLYFLGLRGPCEVESSELNETNQLNAAHGLAWSYYFGYLRFVLPGMDERVRHTTWLQEGQPDSPGAPTLVPKLFILMPESCYAPHTLTDIDPSISHAGELNPVLANRAGNVQRKYANNVYRFTQEGSGKVYHCVVEYASPLMSLYEMAQSDESALTHEQKHYQMQLFHTTLSSILRQAPSGHNCVLVSYRDRLDNGSYYPISRLLQKEIECEISSAVSAF